jgi:GlpG protein
MIAFASLADRSMAEKITQEIMKQGMNASFEEDVVNKQFILLVENEDSVLQAQDIYRVMMGLPRRFEQPEEWSEIQSVSMGPVTKYVIVFCIGVFILGEYKIVPELYPVMMLTPDFFSNFNIANIYKLVTPVFIHFGLIHIIFNMMWMKDLGKIVELERGANFLIFFIIIVGALSNISQFFSTGANFGGMSGVIYGLLGHLWMYKKFNPSAKFSLPKHDVLIMVGWFFLCLSGLLVFSIANMAHAVGLTLGMLAGMFFGIRSSDGKFKLKDLVVFSIFALALPILTQVVELIKISMKSAS